MCIEPVMVGIHLDNTGSWINPKRSIIIVPHRGSLTYAHERGNSPIVDGKMM